MRQRQEPYQGWDMTNSPTQVYFPVEETLQPKRRWGLFLLAFLVLFLVGALGAGGVGLALYSNSDRIVPGVEVAGIELGGQTTAEAITTLENQWQNQTIVLQAGEQSWQASAAELGISLNAEATVQQAYLQGRSMNSLENLLHAGRLEVRPVWEFNDAQAETYFNQLAPAVAHEAVDAGVQIVNGRAIVTPPVNGLELDVPATMNNLRLGPITVLANGRLDLITRPIAPTITDATAVAEAANQLLATNITIHAFDPVTGETTNGVVTPEMWSSWLSLNILDAANGRFEWAVDEPSLQNFLVSQAQSFGPERYLDLDQASSAVTEAINNQGTDVNVRVYHHDRQHVVQSGETLASIGRDYGIPYPWIQQANPDLGDGLFVGQTITIPSQDVMLPLPLVQNKRIIVSISQQRAWVYENGSLKWDWPASTGIDDSPTAPGIFQIQSHVDNAYANNWDLWMPNFMGVYRPVPTSDFMNGFHGFPTRNGSQLLWTNSLGHKVTYGCILLSSDNAATLYNWAEEGIVVEIQP
ncbi:MAG: L,D-transpeptidase family protein [Candidatus Promineifilaceae bacterium]